MATTVGKLSVQLVAHTKQFKSGMRGAGKDLGTFRKGVAKTGSALGGLKSKLAGAFGVAAIGYFVKSQMAVLDTVAKTSRRLGIQAERLQELHHAAKLSGVGISTMNMALQRMTRRLAEAAGGTGESVKAIKELGLDARKLAAMAPDKALAEIAEALEKVTNQADKVRLAFKLFDSEGVSLLQTLEGGSATLQQAAKDLKALGGAVSTGDIAKIEKLNDQITRLKARAGLAAGKVAAATGPSIFAGLEGFAKIPLHLTKYANQFTAEINRAAMGVGDVLGHDAMATHHQKQLHSQKRFIDELNRALGIEPARKPWGRNKFGGSLKPPPAPTLPPASAHVALSKQIADAVQVGQGRLINAFNRRSTRQELGRAGGDWLAKSLGSMVKGNMFDPWAGKLTKAKLDIESRKPDARTIGPAFGSLEAARLMQGRGDPTLKEMQKSLKVLREINAAIKKLETPQPVNL